VSLIISTLTWNGKEHLEKLYPTLKAALEKIKEPSFWYIRDNNSNDGTKELVESWNEDFIRYHYIDHNNDNFSKGNNWVVDKANEEIGIDRNNDFILLLNNDITIADLFSLFNMYHIMKSDRSVGIVGARLIYPSVNNSKFLQHAGVIFSPRYGYNPYHYRHQEQDDENSRKNREFQCVTGACMLVRASCWFNTRTGGMDERFWWAFDDVNMNLDIKHVQGMKVVYCGLTNIIHHESPSLKKNGVNRQYMKHNVMLYQKLWRKIIAVDHYEYMNNKNHMLYKY